jgi:hypothetical protein
MLANEGKGLDFKHEHFPAKFEKVIKAVKAEEEQQVIGLISMNEKDFVWAGQK